MAVHFAAGLNYAQRTAGGFLNPNAASTVMMWVRFGTIQAVPNYNLAYALLDDPAVYTQYVTIDGATTSNNLELTITGIGAAQTLYTLNVGQWYHVCWVQASGGVAGQSFFVNGTQIGSTAFVNRSAWTIGYEMIGNDTFATSDIDLQDFRSWQAVLTLEQIRTEMQSTTAVHATPFMDTPLTANLNDISGNARNWTLVGADSFVTGPSFPANSTAATATVISGLPTSVTTDFEDGMYGWYTYVSVPVDIEVGFFALATLSDSLLTTTYYGTSSSMSFLSEITNAPVEVPTGGGDTFFWRVFSSPSQPSTDVTVSMEIAPQDTAPIGSIVVSDDGNAAVNSTTNFPATFLDAFTGSTLRVATSAAGEFGTVLPMSGQVCLYDVTTDVVQIYPAELGTPTVTIADADFHNPSAIGTDQTTQFYLGGNQAATTCHVRTLSPAGVIGATDYPITIAGATNLKAIAPSRDNTVLYYANTGLGAAIRRWDLIGNVAMTNLVAGVANHEVIEDILVLSDTTILIGYRKTSAVSDYFVRRYDSSGATLNTYTFGATNAVHHTAMAMDDPDSFWVWLYLDSDTSWPYGGSVSRFSNVRVSDGTILQSFDAVNFEEGVYRGVPVEDPIRFGHSFSCPFWINRVGITPPSPGEPEEFLIRRERWFPVLNQENQRMTFSMLQIDLQAGNGLTVGQGENPLMELDWSDDAGWTWSNLRFLPTGRLGQYNRRAIARVLGQSRQRVFRIAVSDPVQWVILDGYMQLKGGTS